MSGEMLTTKEAAAVLGISTSSLHKSRTGGTGPLIPYVVVGGSVRYLASDLEDFIFENRVQPVRAADSGRIDH